MSPDLGEMSGASPASFVDRYVEEYSGPVAAWRVERGAQQLELRNGLPLAAGDCITLDTGAAGAASAKMILVIDGVETTVSRARPQYCVGDLPASNPILLAISHAFASFVGVFRDAETDYNTQSVVSTASRSPSASVKLPVLAHDDQRLAAGKRALSLAWVGGKPPYSIALARAGSAQSVASGRGGATRVRLAPVVLTPGTYSVTVTDAANASTTSSFTVVPVTALPAPSADVAKILDDAALSADVRATYAAASLMSDPSDAWRMEAYQRLAGHDGSALGRRLLFQLENYG